MHRSFLLAYLSFPLGRHTFLETRSSDWYSIVVFSAPGCKFLQALISLDHDVTVAIRLFFTLLNNPRGRLGFECCLFIGARAARSQFDQLAVISWHQRRIGSYSVDTVI